MSYNSYKLDFGPALMNLKKSCREHGDLFKKTPTHEELVVEFEEEKYTEGYSTFQGCLLN